jgi:hypothetical protein
MPPKVKAIVTEQVEVMTKKLPLKLKVRLFFITTKMRRSYIQSICESFSRKVPGGVGRLKSMIANAADKAHNGRLRSTARSVAGTRDDWQGLY